MHIVAHTRGGYRDVAGWESAHWLWWRIRRVFPDAVSNKLMPEHTHTVAPCDELRLAAFRRVLQHHGRLFGTRWDVATPTPCHSRTILRRMVRYNYLNAVRRNLVTDPLLWPWCTLRDALGLVDDPWAGASTIRKVLGYTPAQLWKYTTDHDLCRGLRAPVLRAPNSDVPFASNLSAVAAACASAMRCAPGSRQRKGHPMRATFVGLALDIGNPPLDALAAECNLSLRAVHHLRRRADPVIVGRAKRCLLDPRLHIWQTPNSPHQQTA